MLTIIVLTIVGVVLELMGALQHAVGDHAVGENAAEQFEIDAEMLVGGLEIQSDMFGDHRRIEKELLLTVVQRSVRTPYGVVIVMLLTRVLETVVHIGRHRFDLDVSDVG